MTHYLIGQVFERLSVIAFAEKDARGHYRWSCQCSCGNTAIVEGSNLISGHTRSCGCLKNDLLVQRSKKDIAGMRFERLVAIEATDKRHGSKTIWRCQCDCGSIKLASIDKLLSGELRSCGCLHTDMLKAQHGDKHPNWQGGVSFYPYCPKFNEAKKEEVREVHGRKCAYCGRPESENLTSTGKLKKLSVHHVNRDKEQGCGGKKWELIPLCMHCHAHAHT